MTTPDYIKKKKIVHYDKLYKTLTVNLPGGKKHDKVMAFSNFSFEIVAIKLYNMTYWWIYIICCNQLDAKDEGKQDIEPHVL